MNRCNSPRLVALLAALALTSACEEPSRLISGSGRLEVVVAGAAEALRHGDAIDLGETLLGVALERDLLLRNTGDAALDLGAHQLSASGFALHGIVSGDCSPLAPGASTLGPGECRAVRVVFAASEEGIAQTVWRLPHAGRGLTELVFLASASERRLAVCITDVRDGAPQETCSSATVRDMVVDFGPVPAGAVGRRIVRFGNLGRSRIDVAPPDAVPADARELSLAGIEFPLSLAPGEWRTGELRFVPAEPGEHAVRWSVPDPSPRLPPLNIEVRGETRRPMVCANPSALEFPDVPTLYGLELGEVQLTNCGNEPLVLSDITVIGPPFSADDALPAVTLETGESTTVRLRFAPAEHGEHEGAVKFATNDPLGPFGEIPLRGRAVRCRFEISPLALDFGTVFAESTALRSLTLKNVGDGSCRLPSWRLDTAAMVSKYAVVSVSTDGPVGPGESAELVVEFTAWSSHFGYRGALIFTSVDQDSGEYVDTTVTLTGDGIPLTGCRLEWSQGNQNGCTVDFGPVGLHQSRDVEVRLENVGDEECVVMPPTLGQATDIVFKLGAHPRPFPATVPPGGSIGIVTRFVPGSQWGRWGADPRNHLQVESNSRHVGVCSGRRIRIQLEGHVAYDALDAVPSRLDFGEVRRGCAGAVREVRLYNAGTSTISVSSVNLSGAPAFALVAPPTLPRQLAPGQSLALAVRYVPSLTLDSDSATLVFQHDRGTAPLEVPLAGQGVWGARRTDQFTQALAPQADVLWVVDNSGSMANKQELMPPNATRFVSALQGANIDLRMAVIGVDWGEPGSGSGWPHIADQTSAYPGAQIRAGEFFGVPQIIDSTHSNPAGALARNIRIGECCADTAEGGLEAAKVALSPPLTLDPSKPNGQFLRAGARLSVIVLSDEDDQSPAVDVGYYADVLLNLKGRKGAGLFELHAVTAGPDSGCSVFVNGETISADAAPRYHAVVQRSGGLHRSICTPDWGSIATDLANHIAAPQRAFVLSGDAEPGSLQVSVDGAASVAGVDYDFDPVTSTVTFRPSSVPPRGASIRAEYDPRCH